jgi:hypothetical protein
VELLVVPGIDPFFTMVQTAANLKSARLVTGVSAKMDSAELARRIGKAWEDLARTASIRSHSKSFRPAGRHRLSISDRIRHGSGPRTSKWSMICGWI